MTTATLHLAPWLPADLSSLQRSVIEQAIASIGVAEEGGSNRGPQIDGYLRELGVPLGQPWCAAWASAIWRAAGARVPPGWRGASCDQWMQWGMQEGLWSATATYGAAVLYGIPGDASHIGIIVRLTPHLYSVEGNTIVGTSFSREGVAVDLKEVLASRVLGYIAPHAGDTA